MEAKPESAVEAVAWAMTDYQADGENTQFTRDRHAAEYWGGQGIQIDPLYPQSALDALRGEVERLREANQLYSFAMNTAGIDELKRRADAAERRVGELEALLAAIRLYAQHDDACGDMDAYNNATIESCGCGLDSLLDASSEALTGADPT